MTTISKDKQYRTRDGLEVRLYAVDGAIGEPIHGAIKKPDEGWVSYSWNETGIFWGGSDESDYDLIEVKPRFLIERWVNVYRWPGEDISIGRNLHSTKEQAMQIRGSEPCILATKRIIIEGTEGEDDEEGK